jgi:hypothetical protein
MVSPSESIGQRVNILGFIPTPEKIRLHRAV